MAKIQEVAKAAKVSVSTVSRAFREDVSISEDKRQRVLSVAAELGYSPNLLARSLKSNSTKTIGVISSIETPFYVDIIKGIESELLKMGFQMLIGPGVSSPERERYYLELMNGYQVAGIILTPFEDDNSDYVRMLHDKGVPIIQMFRYPHEFLDSVVVDDERGAYLATKDLLQNGHKRILLVDVPVSFAYQRSVGYLKAFNEANIEPDMSMIVKLKSPDSDELHSIMQRLKPTAVITGVHDFGKLIIKYARKYKVKIPDDLSVIMFDNVEWMEMMQLDAIAQPVDYIGISSSRLLADRISGEAASREPVSLVLQPRLIKRGSVKKIN